MRYLRGILCMASICAALLLLALASVSADAQPRATLPSKPEELPLPKRPYHAIGVNSCAATACHGSVRPDVRAAMDSKFIRRDEFIVWSDRDPHARSLMTLESKRSRQMFVELGIKDDSGQILNQSGLSHCQSCHATQVHDPITQKISIEAVSCEACHGGAEVWGAKHYQTPGTASARLGMADLKRPAGRANACVSCHVGDADHEVNHDMIAAGHPPLKFEMAAYHDLLPKHWNEFRERQANPNFEMELWSAGQKASTESALSLLANRLNRSESQAKDWGSDAVWPEFAEFDCFACHHDLKEGSWYRPRTKAPGELATWSPWYFWDASHDPPELAALRKDLQGTLGTSMERINHVGTYEPPAKPTVAPESWDAAVQQYLYLSAKLRARHDAAIKAKQPWLGKQQVHQRLRELRKLLAFDPGLDSPSSDDSEARREQVQTLIKSLQEDLEQ